jgi:hypothetical protein
MIGFSINIMMVWIWLVLWTTDPVNATSYLTAIAISGFFAVICLIMED